MIIVKTKNGDRFINDKAVTMVGHDREKAVVNAYGDKGVFHHIEDVEGVIYTNDAQPTTWTDEGSDLATLNKKLDEAWKHNSELRAHCMVLENEKDQLKNEIRNLQKQLAERPAVDAVPTFYGDNVAATVYHEMERMENTEIDRQKQEYPGRVQYQKSGNARRFINACGQNNIVTVDDLLKIGRARFAEFKNIGSQCVEEVSQALWNLYAIKVW